MKTVKQEIRKAILAAKQKLAELEIYNIERGKKELAQQIRFNLERLNMFVFREDGKWAGVYYGVVAYNDELLLLVRILWGTGSRATSARTCSSLQKRLEESLRKRGGRNVAIYLATNKWLSKKAFAIIKSLTNMYESVIDSDVINPWSS